MEEKSIKIPGEINERAILFIRGQKVVLDADLTVLYGVATKVLNQAVKRNSKRFPADFMFQLTPEEKSELVAICDRFQRRYPATDTGNWETETGETGEVWEKEGGYRELK